ncbi:hypothetical protein HDE_01821 [Halotydeus destructor]|nr:hypothetical protein HDE_01821 [Halotydeus destructor]
MKLPMPISKPIKVNNNKPAKAITMRLFHTEGLAPPSESLPSSRLGCSSVCLRKQNKYPNTTAMHKAINPVMAYGILMVTFSFLHRICTSFSVSLESPSEGVSPADKNGLANRGATSAPMPKQKCRAWRKGWLSLPHIYKTSTVESNIKSIPVTPCHKDNRNYQSLLLTIVNHTSSKTANEGQAQKSKERSGPRYIDDTAAHDGQGDHHR